MKMSTKPDPPTPETPKDPKPKPPLDPATPAPDKVKDTPKGKPVEKPLVEFVPDEKATDDQLIERIEAIEIENKRMAKIINKSEKEATGKLLEKLPEKLRKKHEKKSIEELTDLLEMRASGTPEFITEQQVTPSEPVKIKHHWDPTKGTAGDWVYI